MRGEPDLASVAALIGDPSRAAILAALADGRALPAGELASAAGLSLSGASAHLARLARGGLIQAEQEGRHRYYRLAGPLVAAALEALVPLATIAARPRARSAESEALRRGRTCYDHLAGALGVALTERLEAEGLVAPGGGKRLEVTAVGARWFADSLDIDIAALRPGRLGLARLCLDGTERRHHLAGPLGAALLRRCRERGWVRPAGGRAVALSPAGARWLREALALTLSDAQG